MFTTQNQKEALLELLQATDELDVAPGCENYPEAFFPTDTLTGNSHDVRWAKETCGGCGVRKLCASSGIKYERHGIWGGLVPRERDQLRKAMGIALPVIEDAA